MDTITSNLSHDPLPFFVTAPGQTDTLFIAVSIFMVLVLVGFGALYFTVQAWPDRMASGMGKTQIQIVGLLGLLSLITFNNAFWVAALLLAAIPISQIVLPVKVKSLRSGRTGKRRNR